MEFSLQLPLLPQVLRLPLSLMKSGGMINNSRQYIGRKLTMADDFDIDFNTGFIPARPLPRLEKPFDIWEAALAVAPDVLCLGDDESEMAMERRERGNAWRGRVKSWPVLDVTPLRGDRRRLQRAHMLLAWLVNFFVHSKPPAKGPIHVPRSLSVPLVGVSQMLGIAPVLTYADTVLWNWELVNPEKPTVYDNVRITNAFSDTDDERNFYAVSVQVELEGVAILRILDEYHSLRGPPDQTAIARIGELLIGLAGLIDYMNDIIQSVRERCDHRVFYHDIRPWLEGSDSKTPGYRNWIYEGVKDSNTLDLSGPSGGQSSVLHALDAFLGVDHKRKRGGMTENADGGFMERMTRYMPGSHRAYLARLAAMPRPIRELALRTPTLREPYNLAVSALKNLREKHMRIAFRYIVTMSRAFQGKSTCPLGSSVGSAGESNGVVLGTGGNDVARLLTVCRDATRSTLLV